MLSAALPPGRTAPPTRRVAIAGVVLALIVSAAALLWAKWLPYQAKAATLSSTHRWSGPGILGAGGVRPGDAPSWHAATSFATAYVRAIWRALVAALLISSAVQAFVPRAWLLRLLNRDGHLRSAAVGAAVSTPTMMCTCCTAPVTATLRSDGVSTAAAVAYWLGNPLLNPAVLVFLAFVAPWQWAATRLLVGLIVVIGGAALVARVTERPAAARLEGAYGPGAAEDGSPEEVETLGWLADAPRRFGATLLRLTVRLVPEYLLVVLVVGAVRGWLFPLGHTRPAAVAVVTVLAAVAGTLVVVPTAGEIPILQGLVLAGLSLGGVGALLLTLPAVSLPGMAMVGRSLGWRTTLATAATVVAGGVAAGGLLLVL